VRIWHRAARMRHASSLAAAAILASCAPAPTAGPPVTMGGTPAAPPGPGPAAPAEQEDHHHGGPLVHRFENAEQWAKEFEGPERDAWQRPAEVIAALHLTPGMTVADVGAGTGYFLPHLSRAVGPKGKVLALDIEPDMVRYMKERAAREGLGNVEPAVVPLDDPRLPAGGVDRVLIVDTWHHIDGRPAYAAKLRAALAPGGAVFVVDFKLEASHGPPREHRLLPEQVIAELGQGGLAAEVVPTSLPEQYVVAGRRP
jgi:SAM-dependent methyltransferase